MRTRNIYGLPAWQFRILKAQYEALPADKKQKIAEAEQKAVTQAWENIKSNLVAMGGEEINGGILLKSKPAEKGALK